MSIVKKIDEALESLLDRMGSEKVLHILSTLNRRMDRDFLNDNFREQVREFVISQTLKVFDLPHRGLFSRKTREHRQARMVIYHLLYHYGKLSYQAIGLHVGQVAKHNVLYNVHRCQDYLNVYPASHDFVINYRRIESELLLFIAGLAR